MDGCRRPWRGDTMILCKSQPWWHGSTGDYRREMAPAIALPETTTERCAGMLPAFINTAIPKMGRPAFRIELDALPSVAAGGYPQGSPVMNNRTRPQEAAQYPVNISSQTTQDQSPVKDRRHSHLAKVSLGETGRRGSCLQENESRPWSCPRAHRSGVRPFSEFPYPGANADTPPSQPVP